MNRFLEKNFWQNIWPWAVILFACFLYYSQHQYLSREILPIGVGPDEIAHLDNSYFKLRKPNHEIRLIDGLSSPGKSPIFQGHQAPLSYYIGEKVISFHHGDDLLGPFFDYQAGILLNSDLEKYPSYYTLKKDVDAQTLKFREGSYLLRQLGGLYYVLFIILSFTLFAKIVKKRKLLAVSFILFAASLPSSIWQSYFFNNDVLVTVLSAAVFLLALYFLLEKSLLSKSVKYTYLFLALCSVFSSAAFLTKYNGAGAFVFIGLAILLKVGPSIKEKLKQGLFCGIIFSIIIVPELSYNLKELGELVPNSYMVKVSPHLYKPQSLLTLLSDKNYLLGIYRSFWINFSGEVDSLMFKFWNGIVSLSFLGWGLYFLFKNRFYSEEEKNILGKVLKFSFLSASSCLVIFLSFSLKFPIANAKYLFTAKLPIMLLIYFGIFNLLSFLPLKKFVLQAAFVFLSAALFVSTNLYIKNFGVSKHQKNISRDLQTKGGVELVSGDIDGDGTDELLFYQRIRGRLFVAKYSPKKESYEIIPELTKVTGKISSEITAGKFMGEKADEIIFWDKAKSKFQVLNPESLFENEQKSNFANYILHLNTFFLPSPPGSSLFIIKNEARDSASKNKLFLFNNREHSRWIIQDERSVGFLSLESDMFNPSLGKEVKVPQEFESPFILKHESKNYFGNISQNKKEALFVNSEKFEQKFKIKLSEHDNFSVADVNNDGNSEFISWESDATCLNIIYFNLEAKVLSKEKEFCPKYKGKEIKFSNHFKLFNIKVDSTHGLAAYDYLKGDVYIISSSIKSEDSCSQILEKKQKIKGCNVSLKYNPGW